MRRRGELFPLTPLALPLLTNDKQALANGVLITRLKTLPIASSQSPKEAAEWTVRPALKVCVTMGLSKKDIEKAGVTIRHAVTKVMTRKASSKLGLPVAA